MVKDNVLAAVLVIDFLTTPSKDLEFAYGWAERILTTHQMSPEYLMHIYNAFSNKEIEINSIIEYVTAITSDSVDTAINDIQKCKRPNWKDLKKDSLMKAYDAMQVVYKKNYEQDNPYVYTPEQIRDALSKANTLTNQIELKILFDEEEMRKTLKFFKFKNQRGLLEYSSEQAKEIEYMVPKNNIRRSKEDILELALLLITKNKLRNMIIGNPIATIAYLKTTNDKDFANAYSNMISNYRTINEYRSKYIDYLQEYNINNINIKNFSATPLEYSNKLHILILKDYYTFIINNLNKRN